ncbi:RmlC-like cupin domain-containing protein [Lyophyllum atratum]|nr:RmlC-like cupin domain-containing protein [Lyophyllum atratum]
MTSVFPSVLTHADLPPLYDDEPETDTVANFKDPLQLVVEGQGIVAVQVKPGVQFSIILTPSAELGDNDTGLKLELTEKSAKFFAITLHSSTEIPSVTPKGPTAPLLVPGVEDLYWLSVDQKNGSLRYGKTYRSASTTFLKATVDVGDKATKPGPFIWVKSLKHVSIVSDIRPDLGQVSIGSLPIVNDLPPIVAESVEVTLEDLAISTTTSIANLSPECQRLYANVTGPGVKLDDKNFPDFSQALEFSIRTPGKICYEKLKAKADEFGDPEMTYLRITLGSDEGNSPGVPFVMEIWPSKHRSPIHDHGEAYAVIKVLHGEINASYFTKLDHKSGIKLEPDFTFQKDQVTWIGPDNYQVHQLHNDSDRVCVTIQCYQYANTDRAHDEYFEYLDAKSGDKEPFYPDSDWDFVAFKRLIKAEWEAHLKKLEWK